MEVILLERVAKLGQIGDVVRVKDGYARNFLLRKGKALRATQENKTRFESMKTQLEARNLELRSEAAKVAHKLEGRSFAVLRQAAESGQLYGSVSARDLAALVAEGGFTVERGQIELNAPIKTIGRHQVPISLHPEVAVTVTVNVARSAEEAERLARGEMVLGPEAQEAAEQAAEAAAAESFFEKPEALESDQGEGAEKAD
jgi:large subunit ribosomal protein L9